MTPTIQREIELLQNTKEEIKIAIMEKGVTVQSSDTFSMFPTRISQISMTPGDKDNLFKSLIDRSITSFDVPNGTASLRPNAFTGCVNLASLTLPNSLITIHDGALHGLNALTTLVIPDSVTTIEDCSGYSTSTSLTTLTLGSGLTYIGNNAFRNNSNLTSITCLATTPPTLGSNNNAFNNTNNCPIYVPEGSVTAYQTAWPTYASRIQAMPSYKATLTLSDNSVVNIDDDGSGELYASELLSYQNTLRELEVYSCVDTIDYEACHRFTALTTVTLDESVTTLEDYAFNRCTSLTSFTAPGITSWGQQALFQSAITYYEIPYGTTATGILSFAESHLEEVVFPEDFIEVGAGSFMYCSSLTSVTLPDSVTSILLDAFANCTSLQSITCLATIPPTLEELPGGGTTTSFDNTNNCPIYVPAESVEDYKLAWSVYASRIEAIPVPSKAVMTYDNMGVTSTLSLPEDYVCQYETDPYPTILMDCDWTEAFSGVTIPYNVETITINDTIEEINVTLYGFNNLQSITCLATTPPMLSYGDSTFDDYETNSCPIYVPADSLQDYLDDPEWSNYASRLDAIPVPVVPKFVKITNVNDVTDGKYLIVDENNNTALDASLITSTASSSTGLNSSTNTISVTISNGEIVADATTLNAAADYDATNQKLTWTDTNNTTYYIYQNRTTSSSYSTSNRTMPSSNITPQVSSSPYTYSTFKQNYYLSRYSSTKINWSSGTSSSMENMVLYKYVQQ